MKYSVIVPVFNRPEEVDELLASLAEQRFRDFEVLIVEDGSSVPCKSVVDKYSDRLDVRYFVKENEGPGQARNYGAERARGMWLIILDSDVIVPGDYFFAIEDGLMMDEDCEAFGGPDRAHESFTDMQKAINYSMTSFFTTGGIRGGKRKMDKFYPRSFNMGIWHSVYKALGGFSKMRFGEDIDLSIRLFDEGYICRLFPQAWVYHKRRTDLCKFFKQVHNSGIARINLYKKYPESLKLVHLLPAAFTVGCFVLFWCGFLNHHFWELPLIYAWFIFIDATIIQLFGRGIFEDTAAKDFKKNSFWKSVKIGLLSVAATFVQLIGYGSGFLRAWWERCVLGRGELEAFKKNFYK